MYIDWLAVSAIFFGLLLLFEVYRYFWPGLKRKKQERKEAIQNVKQFAQGTIQRLNQYESAIVDPSPNALLPGWLHGRAMELTKNLVEYNLFLEEGISVICEALCQDSSAEVRRLKDKWIEAGLGPLEDCLVRCISPAFWEAKIDRVSLQDVLMQQYGKDRPIVKQVVDSEEFYAVVNRLNRICERRKSITQVRELRATCIKQVNELKGKIDKKEITLKIGVEH